MKNKVLRIGALYDFYGALLTDKQQKCIEFRYLNDLSLSEIADEFKVSRQAIYDILRRSEQILTEYEEKLGLVERYRLDQKQIRTVVNILSELAADNQQKLPRINEAFNLLMAVLK